MLLPIDWDMQAFVAMAILETVHHLLQSHVDNRRGSDAMRTLSELLDRAMEGQKALHFSFRPGTILSKGSPLPESSVSQELCRLFLREGFEDLVFLPVPAAEELALWVDTLRAHYRRRVACDAEQNLQPCLLNADFQHLKFGFSLTRKLQNRAGEFGPRWDPGSRRSTMTWEEEAMLESCRQLDVDFGMTLMEDLETHPRTQAWPQEAVQILGGLLEHLVAKGRYRACLPILDRALECPILSVREGLETCLATFRSTDRLEHYLRALCAGFDPALTDFLKRLGPVIAPFLLAKEDQYPTPALHALLEHFLKEDMQPFQDLLDCGNSQIEHRAISYLLDSGQALPPELLEGLAQSKTDWVQKRAMQLLAAQTPTRLSEEQALFMLEHEQESTRIQALCRMREPGCADQSAGLLLWFERSERRMSFAERKEAMLSLALSLGDQALAFLQPFLQTDTERRRRSDLDNLLCAILALGALSDQRAHEMLIELSESQEEAIHETALQALAS